MAAWDDESLVTLAGFIIVLIVGLNIVFAFNIGGGITGGATIETGCYDVADGIQCSGSLYVKTPATGLCPEATAPVCTNACEAQALLKDKTPTCSDNCRTICMPQEFIGKL